MIDHSFIDFLFFFFLFVIKVCDEESSTSATCLTVSYQDGFCDNDLNNEYCGWDGGDCHQLCDFEECEIEVFGDGICDIQCNTTACNFDNGDCV